MVADMRSELSKADKRNISWLYLGRRNLMIDLVVRPNILVVAPMGIGSAANNLVEPIDYASELKGLFEHEYLLPVEFLSRKLIAFLLCG